MNNFLLALGTLVAAVLIALFAVPPLIDWNGYRGLLEEEASRALGREVRVGGKVDVRILPTPYMRFEDVTVADAAGITGAPFLRAKSFTLWLAVPPLLRGVLEAERIELDRADLRLRVDAAGGGNWQTLRFAPTFSGLIPVDITLKAMQLKQLRVTFEAANGRQIAMLDEISGDLSALHLSGPYKFTGTQGAGAAARDVRISTSEPGADGRVRLRAQIREASNERSLTVDGDLTSLDQRPQFDGTASYLASRPGTDAGARQEGAAKIAIDTHGMTLSDISVAFENKGPPQLLTGAASLRWRDQTELTAALASRWLDIDRIGGLGEKAGPLGLLAGLTSATRSLTGLPDRIKASLAIDQATVGGEVVSDARIAISRSGERLQLDQARASLPGGTSAQAAGEILERGANLGFGGQIQLDGRSLARFLDWAAKGTRMPAVLAKPARDAAFSFDGAVSAGGDSFAITDARISFGDDAMRLSAAHRASTSAPLLNVSVRAPRLDLGAFAPGALSPDSVVALLAARGFGTATTNGETRLSITAEELTDGATTYRDVSVAAALVDGRLTLERLALVPAAGARFELHGSLGARSGQPNGELRGLLVSANRTGATALRRLLTPLLPSPALTTWLETSRPISLAVHAALGRAPKAGESPSDGRNSLSLEGRIGGDRIRVDATNSGAPADWLNQPLDLSARLSDADLSRTVAALLPAGAAAPATGSGRPPVTGDVVVRALGTPASGLDVNALIAAPGLAARYLGRVTLDRERARSWSGRASVDGQQLATVLEVVWPALAARVPPVGVHGDLAIAREVDGDLTVRLDAVRLGTATMSGLVTMAARGPAPAATSPARTSGVAPGSGVWRGNIAVDTLSLPAVLGVITTPAAAEAPAGARTTARPDRARTTAPLWTDRSFEFAALGGVQAEIAVSADRIDLDAGLGLGATTFKLNAEPDRVALDGLSVRVAGGTAAGRLSLSEAPAGVTVDGQVKLIEASLAEIGGNASAVSGRIDGELAFRGQALSPRALSAAIKGTGTIQLAKSEVAGISPAAILRTAIAAMGARPGSASDAGANGASPPAEALEGEALTTVLMQMLREGRMTLGDRSATLQVLDGALRVSDIAIADPSGSATNRMTVDLGSLEVESEWRLAAQPLGAEAGILAGRVLPPMTLYFVGPLATFGGTPPRLDADALLRELAVLKMERDVRELELMRREDEARAKAAEAARQAEEAERLRLQREDDARRAAAAGAQGAAATQALGAPAQSAPATPWITRVPGQVAPLPAPQPIPSPVPATRPRSEAPVAGTRRFETAPAR